VNKCKNVYQSVVTVLICRQLESVAGKGQKKIKLEASLGDGWVERFEEQRNRQHGRKSVTGDDAPIDHGVPT
jgi:rRNA-processing protein FCF1